MTGTAAPVRRRWVKRALQALGPLLFGFLLYRSDPQRIWSHLAAVDPLLYALVFPVSWLAIALRAERWRRLAADGHTGLSPLQALASYLGGVFWGSVTPGRVGEILRIRYLREHGVALPRAVTVVLLDRGLDVACLLLVAVIAVAAFRTSVDPVPGAALGWAVVGAAALAGVLALAVAGGGRLGPGRLGRALGALRAGVFACAAVVRDVPPVLWGLAVAATALSWLIFMQSRMLVAWSLDIGVDFWFFSGAIAVASLLSLLPITIQGIGTRDVALVVMLGWAGVSAESSLALSALILGVMLVNTALGRAIFVAVRARQGGRT